MKCKVAWLAQGGMAGRRGSIRCEGYRRIPRCSRRSVLTAPLQCGDGPGHVNACLASRMTPKGASAVPLPASQMARLANCNRQARDAGNVEEFACPLQMLSEAGRSGGAHLQFCRAGSLAFKW